MEVRILGPLEVWADGHQVELGGGRLRGLLAILVLNLNDVVSSDRLIEDLWGEQPPPTATKALQNLVAQLRKALDPARAGVLLTQSPGYALRLDDDAVDARRFERLAVEGRRALEADPARAAGRLHEALSLWRGEALADFAYESFARGEIARLGELRLAAIEDRCDADLAQGGAAELVSELEALVAANPARERLRGQLMLALYRGGRQTDALEVYREGRGALQDELGLEPGPALRELQQAILNHDPELGQPSRPPMPTRRSRRVRIGAALGALAALIALAFVAVLMSRSDAAPVVVPDSLVKIDAATNEIVDVHRVGRDPGEVAVVGDYVFVASEGDQTLFRLDTGSGETATSGALAAGGPLVGAGDRFLWVSSEARAEVVRIDVDSLLPIDRVSLSPDLLHAFVAVGGGSLWVSQYAPPAVSRWRLRSLQLERRYGLPFAEFPVEVTFGDGAAWVGLGASNELLRIDARDGNTTRIPVGSGPADPTLGFGSIWVAAVNDGTVWRVDPLSGEARAITKVGNAPFALAVGAGSTWVANHCDGTVSKIDSTTDEVVATIETGYFPKWLAVGHGHVWVGVSGKEAFDFPSCNS